MHNIHKCHFRRSEPRVSKDFKGKFFLKVFSEAGKAGPYLVTVGGVSIQFAAIDSRPM